MFLLAIFGALIAGVFLGVWVRRSWGKRFLAIVLIAIANSIFWHLVEAFVLYPASRHGSERWETITIPWIALCSVVPAAAGVAIGTLFRVMSSKESQK